MNKEGVMANGLEDERHGHYGVGPRLDAWRAYGHSMLSETVVVHNIKTFAEYLQVAATFRGTRRRLQALRARPSHGRGRCRRTARRGLRGLGGR